MITLTTTHPGAATRDAITATIDPARGARLTSLQIYGDEVIGGAPILAPNNPDWFDGCFPMAPFACNVKAGRVAFGDESFQLPRNSGSHAAHGVVDNTPWRVTDTTSSTLNVTTAMTEAWPFGGWATQRIELSESELELTLTCGNDNRSMPVALGYHPWFRPVVDGANANVDFRPAGRYSETESGMFGTLVSDLGRRPWDDPFLHHDPIGVRWGRLRLELSSSASTWMYYERQPEGFCIEPLTAPPDGLEPGRAIIVRPGRPASLQFKIAWSK